MQDQALPTPGRQNVTPIARAAFREMLDAREQKGIETYGTTLQTFNGRDPYRDALEELTDAIQYVHQARLEHEALLAKVPPRTSVVLSLEDARVLERQIKHYNPPVSPGSVLADVLDRLDDAIYNAQHAAQAEQPAEESLEAGIEVPYTLTPPPGPELLPRGVVQQPAIEPAACQECGGTGQFSSGLSARARFWECGACKGSGRRGGPC